MFSPEALTSLWPWENTSSSHSHYITRIFWALVIMKQGRRILLPRATIDDVMWMKINYSDDLGGFSLKELVPYVCFWYIHLSVTRRSNYLLDIKYEIIKQTKKSQYYKKSLSGSIKEQQKTKIFFLFFQLKTKKEEQGLKTRSGRKLMGNNIFARNMVILCFR